MKSFKQMIDTFKSEVRQTYKSGIELIYYMRGAINKNEMLELTAFERDIISEFIKERLEDEKKKIKNNPNSHMVY